MVEYHESASAELVCDCAELNEDHGVGGPAPRRGDPVWAVYARDTLQAFATARLVDDEVHTRNCVVRPRARGRGYQRELLSARIAWARALGAECVRTYTSMDNWRSYRNLVAAGFALIGAADDPDAAGGAWLYWRLWLP